MPEEYLMHGIFKFRGEDKRVVKKTSTFAGQ